jgi:hypothetical protein
MRFDWVSTAPLIILEGNIRHCFFGVLHALDSKLPCNDHKLRYVISISNRRITCYKLPSLGPWSIYHLPLKAASRSGVDFYTGVHSLR